MKPKRAKRFFMNPWVVSIGSGLLLLVIPSIAKSVTDDISFFDAVKWLFGIVINAIWKFLSFTIPVYAILIAIGVLILALLIYSKCLNNTTVTPDFLQFTTCSYDGWIMRWDYDTYDKRTYHIENVRPVCACGCELSLDEDSYPFVLLCPSCKRNYKIFDVNDVERAGKYIEHRLRTKDYPKRDNN